ncbi:MAG: glycoside hydrolase family 3 protein [Eubacterium sp.]|nr:glycoside hydrolase family 3 protein [Eubacterium sp.]
MRKMRMKLVSLVTVLALSLCGCGQAGNEEDYTVSSERVEQVKQSGDKTPEEIVAGLTTEQKAAQMVQPAIYVLKDEQMKKNDYGSILSKSATITAEEWRTTVDQLQALALASEAGIPFIYGQDDVHGVNYCKNAVYFPQNIGMGAANDPELMYRIGQITADEAKLCHMLWNFAPCVAQSEDPRWGRTYESYGADPEIIRSLGTAYTRGLVDSGLVACAKHYLGDGNVEYGTGENSDVARLIDRGDAVMTEEEINTLLEIYRGQIEAGVQTIMISHSALNGVKMHENKEYIMKLKDEMGFTGFIVSDWNSVQNTSPQTYHDQVVTAVNAGIDMLMEVQTYDEAKDIIVDAVGKGEITEERLNDAVTRIIRVKKNAGLFDDPMCERMKTVQTDTGSKEYRAVAEKAVEESLVLLKNEGNVLPLKPGTGVYITGPAANNAQAQCGGWTVDWNRSPRKEIEGVTTIEEGLKQKAEEFGLTVYTDPEDSSKADVVLLCVGEQAYAEWNGDTEDLQLTGALGLNGNAEAMEEARALGKPVITLIVAGRHVILGEEYNHWDAAVMCYLPGSEGQGVANVLCGKSHFRGKLPSPWYGSVDQIHTEECFLPQGYGLSD